MPAGDPYRRVTSGDPLVLPAEAWNAMLNLVRGDQRGPSPAGNGAAGLGNGIIRVKNNSGADRARWEVLGLDVPLVLPADNAAEFARQVALAGVLPTAAHAGKWALLLEPVAAGAIGRAVASGVTVGKVNVTAGEEARTLADAEAGLAALQMVTAGGAEVLWKEAGTGLLWAVLRFPAPAAAGGGGGGGGGTGTFEVKEADGTPDYTGVSVLVFDSADGFVLSQPAGGQARLDLAAASSTQDGIVTSRAQQIGGEKTFLAGTTYFGGPFGQFFIGNYGSASNPFGGPAGLATELRLSNPNDTQFRCALTLYPEGVALATGKKWAVGSAVGQSGTMSDGSTLTGGLVTAIGPGGVDGGTW